MLAVFAFALQEVKACEILEADGIAAQGQLRFL